MKIADIGNWVELYDTEKYLFEVVGPRVRARGYLVFDEFYEICMWKTARAKPKYLENRNSIERIARTAIAETDERRKMAALCELKGVSISVASALLAVIFPKEYAVIDIRCLAELRKLGYLIGNPSLKTWPIYVETMRQLARENNVSPRELDMALFAMNKRAQAFSNLYAP